MSAVMHGPTAVQGLPVEDPSGGPPIDWSEGVHALVRLLKEPEERIYLWSDLPALPRQAVDWVQLPDRLRSLFEANQCSAIHTLMRIHLALGVLSMNSVKVCRGPVDIEFWEDEACDQYLSLTLSIDADAVVTRRLQKQLRELRIDCNVSTMGILVSYSSVHPYEPRHRPTFLVCDELDDDEE